MKPESNNISPRNNRNNYSPPAHYISSAGKSNIGFKVQAYGRCTSHMDQQSMYIPNPFVNASDHMRESFLSKMQKMATKNIYSHDLSQKKNMKYMQKTLKEMKQKVKSIMTNNHQNIDLYNSQLKEYENMSKFIHSQELSPNIGQRIQKDVLPMIQTRQERIHRLRRYLNQEDEVFKQTLRKKKGN